MGTQQFCLRWNNHQTNLLHVFDTLLQSEALVDVTVACDGLSVKAHKVVLSACSPYFQSLFLDNPCQHPIVILKDISFVELKCIIEFMYKGEVNVTQENLTAFLKAAETLKVKGLAEVASNETATKDPPPSEIPLQPASSILPQSPMTQDPKSTPQTRAYVSSSPTPRRKRFCRPRRPSSSSESDTRELHADSSKNSIEDENRRLINAIKKEAGLDENSADESLLAKLSSAVTGTTQACVDARSPALGNRDSSDSLPAASTCQSSIASQEHLWSSGDHVQTNADGLMSSNQARVILPRRSLDPLPPFSALQPTSHVPTSHNPQCRPLPSPPVNRTSNKSSGLVGEPPLMLEGDNYADHQTKVLLIPPYDLNIYPGQLECCLRMSRGSPTHLLRSLMDIFFESELLANSSFLTLDRTIMDGLKAYVMSLHPTVKESQLNVAATDKCVQTKRRLGVLGMRRQGNEYNGSDG